MLQKLLHGKKKIRREEICDIFVKSGVQLARVRLSLR
jgi:hypothetical protein